MPEHQQTQKSTESKSTVQKPALPRIQAPSSHPLAIIQRARMNPKSLTPADILQLQRTIGNRAVGRLLSEIRSSSAAQNAPVQRQEIPEEEEPLQGKFENNPDQMACPSCFAAPIVQRQEMPEEEELLQGKMIGTVQRQEIPEEEEPLQTKRENNTGMPDNLKAGVENLSGIDMSDVKVHYNSDKPAEVGALAYTQGMNIYMAPGQEKHLPHEAWHVVQQAQGIVQPTIQAKGVSINDNPTLEREADIMGVKAANNKKPDAFPSDKNSTSVIGVRLNDGHSLGRGMGVALPFVIQRNRGVHGVEGDFKSGTPPTGDLELQVIKAKHIGRQFNIAANFSKEQVIPNKAYLDRTIIGEYRQYVRGYFKVNNTIQEVTLANGKKLSKSEFQEDGNIGVNPYGHRDKPQIYGHYTSNTAANTGEYTGEDNPSIGPINKKEAGEMSLDFRGKLVEVEVHPGGRNTLAAFDSREWSIRGKAYNKNGTPVVMGLDDKPPFGWPGWVQGCVASPSSKSGPSTSPTNNTNKIKKKPSVKKGNGALPAHVTQCVYNNVIGKDIPDTPNDQELIKILTLGLSNRQLAEEAGATSVGYHGTSIANAQSILDKIDPPNPGSSAGLHLGEGFYISRKTSEAEDFAGIAVFGSGPELKNGGERAYDGLVADFRKEVASLKGRQLILQIWAADFKSMKQKAVSKATAEEADLDNWAKDYDYFIDAEEKGGSLKEIKFNRRAYSQLIASIYSIS